MYMAIFIVLIGGRQRYCNICFTGERPQDMNDKVRTKEVVRSDIDDQHPNIVQILFCDTDTRY